MTVWSQLGPSGPDCNGFPHIFNSELLSDPSIFHEILAIYMYIYVN